MPPPPRNTNHIDQRPAQPDRRERAKSPVLDAIAGAARALSPVSYLLKPRVGMMNDQFPEDREEEEDEGPSYRSFGAAMSSPVKSRAVEVSRSHHQDASFLSATTANGSEDASRSYGGPSAESSYQFDEEERLMKEIEQERQLDKGKGKAVASGSGTNGGWLGGLPGFRGASPAPSNGASSKKKTAAKDASFRPQSSTPHDDTSSSGSDEGDSDELDLGEEGDKVTKSTSRRKPRISQDNATFKYRPGELASEGSESDGDGGRKKRRRRKPGKIGPLGAEGMAPVVEGKKRKGKKGKRSTTTGRRGEDHSEEEEPDVSMDIPALPRDGYGQEDVSYDDDPTMDFGNDDLREDDSFVVQMSKAAARGPATTSNSSQLPTHFKSKSHGPVAIARDLVLAAVRYALVGLILAWNGLVASLEWAFHGLKQSLNLLDCSLASKAVAAAVIFGTLAILLDQPSAPATGVTRPPTESTSWLPSVHFNRPKHGKGAYRTPDLPPESMDELIERLSQLETALGSLSTQAKQADVQRSQVETHVVQLQDRLSSDLKKVSTEADKRDQAERERLQSLDKVVGKIRGDVDVLSGRVKKMGEQVDSDAKEIERLDDGAEVVKKELKSLSDRVREAEKVAKVAADASRVAKIATEAIESYLPSKLVVRMNPKTNTLDIDPSFWKAMRAVFVEHGQVEPVVASRIDKLQASLDASAASAVAKASGKLVAAAPPPAVVSVAVPQIPSWKEFLSSNEQSLRSWTDAEHDRKASDGAVVSKKTFLEVLHRELETLKVNLEKQATQNMHSIGDEILAKSVAAGKSAAQQAAGPPASGKGKTVTVKTPSGENLSDLITTMIDTALLKYSKDTLAKTDYALYTAGGRVIPSITSDTYSLAPPSSGGWFGGKKKPIEGRPPVTALLAEIGNGECWPVEGGQGQLAVLLAKPVRVTEVVVEHAAREVSFDMDAAPREVEGQYTTASLPTVILCVSSIDILSFQTFSVWALVDGQSAQSKVAAYQASLSSSPTESLPPSPNYILLASFAYDISLPNHIQTFPVSQPILDLDLETGIVVVRIRSNYGAAYTCLYRVRVHGDDLVREREEAFVAEAEAKAGA